jgi:hypothetical protein
VTASRGVLSAIIGIVVSLAVFASYFMTLSRIENDHFVIIARARQVLFGDWPVRDFIDPGMPLTYLLSAAAAWIAGPTLLAEAVLCIGLLALTTAITFSLVSRITGMWALALAAAAATFVVPTRLYSATKVACLVIALWLGSRYAHQSTLARLALLGGWTGLAFLVRMDYAVYVAAAAIVLIVITRDARRVRLKAVSIYTICAFVVVLPWLVYVHLSQGLGEYLASAIRFADAERTRTASSLPWFDWPLAQAANTSPALFYLFVALPCAALVGVARMPPSPARAALAFMATLTVLCDVTFLRDAVTDRLGDVVAPTAIVAAVVAYRVFPRRLAAALALTATAVFVTIGGSRFLEQGGSLVPAEAAQQWNAVADRLRRNDPEVATSGLFIDLSAYISRCTDPTERVLISGFAPEIAVLAGRPFAGGLPAWVIGYYVSPADVRIVETHLARERVGAVVFVEGSDVFVRSWPSVARALLASGFQEYPLVAGVPELRIWVRPDPDEQRVDDATGLPCRSGRWF